MRILGLSLVTASTLVLGLVAIAPIAAAAAPPCGSSLSAGDIADIVELADTSTITSGTDLQRLGTAVDRQHEIVGILVRNHDRRGVFIQGFDTAEQVAVMPIQRDERLLVDPVYARKLSLNFISRYLDQIHAEFTDAPLDYQWQQYFSLARDCAVPLGRLVMVGYIGHIIVDLPRASAIAGGTVANGVDMMRLLDSIATHFDTMVADTKAAYGVDMGPIWRGWFIGDSLNAIAGPGASTQLRRAAFLSDVGIVGLGVTLQNPLLHDATEATIHAGWTASELFLQGLSITGAI